MIDTLLLFLDSLKELSIELLIIGLIFFAVERIRPAEKTTPFFSPAFKNELGLALVNGTVFSPFFKAIIAGILLAAIQKYIPFQIFQTQLAALPLTLQILAACFIMDFSTYWRHRITHRFKWLWPFHSIHHAAKEITWITALRLHPIDILVAITFDVFILHIFGFDAPGIALAIIAIGLYNYFTHANIDLKYPSPIRYIFASPNFHRWHHATEKSAYDKNFCSMFSLLDVMFGTYHHPEELPSGYGLEPKDQKDYPKSLIGWLAYPFKKITKI